MSTILVVDDHENMLDVLSILLQSTGYDVITADTGKNAIGYIESDTRIDLAICDLRLPDRALDGMQVLQRIRASRPATPVVLITAYGNIELAVGAMKQGAADFIAKPFTKNYIRRVVARLLSKDGKTDHRTSSRSSGSVPNIICNSSAMQNVLNQAQRAARFNAPILLIGESGVGKELVAHFIHNNTAAGERSADRPFVSVNCPAIPEALIGSELFGHRKGAFTGASNDYPGKLKQADNGTLFLDEIGELSLSMQPKLLRVLEERTFQPLGGNQSVSFDAQLVCATNRNLIEMANTGAFRGDLLFRINTITIDVPPLRDRPEDIIPLAEQMLEEFCAEFRLPQKEFSKSAIRSLAAHTWPGNVRELRNLVERAVILSESSAITAADFPPEFDYYKAVVNETRTGSMADTDQGDAPEAMTENVRGSNQHTLDEQERSLLDRALRGNNWNLSATARDLGISRNTLRYRIEKHNLRRDRQRP